MTYDQVRVCLDRPGSANFYVVAQTYSGCDTNRPEAAANARLIAAAPEMLEALESLCNQIRNGEPIDTLTARAVIKKAKAES